MARDIAAVIARARILAASGEYKYVYQIERALLFEGTPSVDRALRKEGVKSELRALIAMHRKA